MTQSTDPSHELNDSKEALPPSPTNFSESDEYKTRCGKLKELLDLGIPTYPHTFKNSSSIHEVQDKLAVADQATPQTLGGSEQAIEDSTPSARVYGRIVLMRPMGKNLFAQLQDHTGRIQLMVSRDIVSLSSYQEEEGKARAAKIIEKKFDLGDIIGVEGNLFFTQKGELTILVRHLTLLSKALLPLPDKHHGLNDPETRQRKRWLELISDRSTFSRFESRSKILATIRRILTEHQFLEVETPILQNIYGGANARPFVTHHNSLKTDPFLRISLEIPLKKLLVGGYPRIFELGKVFRNEGIDRTHNPEFTMLELYSAGWDYYDMMDIAEQLFVSCAQSLALKLSAHTFENHTIDLSKPFQRITMLDAVKQVTNIDAKNEPLEQLRALVSEKNDTPLAVANKMSRGECLIALFEEHVEQTLIQPVHIIDHPIESTPLCKRMREELLDPKDPSKEDALVLVERFETFVVGKEFCNAYSELNDPLEQKNLLLAQQNKSNQEENHPIDGEFIEAMSQGMPPAGGLGIGIDRLCMLLTNSSSIRDVLFFPTLRPHN